MRMVVGLHVGLSSVDLDRPTKVPLLLKSFICLVLNRVGCVLGGYNISSRRSKFINLA